MLARLTLLAVLLAGGVADAAALKAEVFLVYWPSVGGNANQGELDSFMHCMLEETNFDQFFTGFGGVQLQYGGSVSLTTQPPGDHFGICDNDLSYTNGLINAGSLPQGAAGFMPLYVFMMPSTIYATNCASGNGCGSYPNCARVCQQGTCGLNTGDIHANGSMQYQEVWVTTYSACCWSGGRTDLNVETEYIQHEVAEALSAALGVSYGSAVGDDCEVADRYNFTGCPSQSGKAADWYVLQKLSNAGKSSCNFVTRYTGPTCSAGQLHDACANNASCCAPMECQLWTLTGTNPSDVCCLPVGASCSGNTDCCGGPNCVNGKCACVASGQFCLQDSDCCSSMVCNSARKCVTAPPDAGTPDAGSQPDAGSTADAGEPADAGRGDGGSGGGTGADGGAEQTHTQLHSCGCGTADSTLIAAVALAQWLARRRRTDERATKSRDG